MTQVQQTSLAPKKSYKLLKIYYFLFSQKMLLLTNLNTTSAGKNASLHRTNATVE